MKKLFTFLCAALMSVGMFAATVVTITQDDFPKDGNSFTKDGVTVSAGMIDSNQGNLTNGGSFSTTLGNFTEIEVTAGNVGIFGPGWNGISGKKTWKGNASSLSFSGSIMGMGMGVTLKFTIEEPAPKIENSITINGTPQVGDNSISLTYYFDPANVPGICCNAPTLKVKCAADNKWDEIWLSLNNISSGTTTITLDELGSFQEGKSYDVCFAYNNGSWVDEVFQSFIPAVPQPAATVVTITDSDFPASGSSFTKDGVTVSAYAIDGMQGNISGPGSFSTTLGNFTKIEVSAASISVSGEGWSGDFEHKTWTGNASSVSFTGSINGYEEGTTLKFTIEPASTPEPAKYYVVGNMTKWAVDENYEMNPNIYAETEEYFYALDLTTTSEFKVVKVEGENQTWYPTGMGNNYGQNGEITEDAEYTIYFRPSYDGGEDWFYNCIYVSKNEPEPAEVTVVFAANNKTAERTVTLPHTFKCDWAGGMERPDELDIIIHELYNDYYYCNSNMNASGSDQVEVGTEEDPKNDYITIKGVFEGTATVTGDYLDYIDDNYGEHNYSITISIKDTPTAVENVQTNHVQATKFFRDGQLLIEKNGKLYNATGAEVK